MLFFCFFFVWWLDFPQAHASRSCWFGFKIAAIFSKPTLLSCEFMCLNYHTCNTSIFFPYVPLNLLLLQLNALIHPFFNELRDPNTRLPNGRFLPPLFNFKSHGMIYHVVLHYTSLILLHLGEDTYWALSLFRAEGSASGCPNETDPWTCEEAVFFSWFVIQLQQWVVLKHVLLVQLLNVGPSNDACLVWICSPKLLCIYNPICE